MNEEIQQKDSLKLTVLYTLIVFSIATLAVLAVIYFVEPEEIPEGSFLNPSPDKDIIISIVDEPEADSEVLVPPPDVIKNLPQFVPNLTDAQKAIDMPQSVVEMAKFLSGKEISTDDLTILMDFAVKQERNDFDYDVDTKARIIMEKLLE